MRSRVALSVLLALAACATSPVPLNSDYSPPLEPEIARGFELRDRYYLPGHVGRTAVYVDSVAVHHVYSEASTIAWRDETGKWQWSQAIETGPGGLLRVERKLESHESRVLTEVEARRLERLIGDRRVYSGEVRRTGEVGVGAPFHVMARWTVDGGFGGLNAPFISTLADCVGPLRAGMAFGDQFWKEMQTAQRWEQRGSERIVYFASGATARLRRMDGVVKAPAP